MKISIKCHVHSKINTTWINKSKTQRIKGKYVSIGLRIHENHLSWQTHPKQQHQFSKIVVKEIQIPHNIRRNSIEKVEWDQTPPRLFGLWRIIYVKKCSNHLYKEFPNKHEPEVVNNFIIVYRNSRRRENYNK